MSNRDAALEAWTGLQKQAELGDGASQLEVAFVFDQGFWVDDEELLPPDLDKAYQWYCRAHENGMIEATVRLADFLSEGLIGTKDVAQAIEYYRIAIAAGSSWAANNLATVYRDMGDYETAFKWFSKSAEIDPSSALPLALCLFYGVGAERDGNAAKEIFLRIANDKSEDRANQFDIDQCNFYLGRMYLEGDCFERSIEQAKHYLQLADSDGDNSAAQELLRVIGRSEQ